MEESTRKNGYCTSKIKTSGAFESAQLIEEIRLKIDPVATITIALSDATMNSAT